MESNSLCEAYFCSLLVARQWCKKKNNLLCQNAILCAPGYAKLAFRGTQAKAASALPLTSALLSSCINISIYLFWEPHATFESYVVAFGAISLSGIFPFLLFWEQSWLQSNQETSCAHGNQLVKQCWPPVSGWCLQWEHPSTLLMDAISVNCVSAEFPCLAPQRFIKRGLCISLPSCSACDSTWTVLQLYNKLTLLFSLLMNCTLSCCCDGSKRLGFGSR